MPPYNRQMRAMVLIKPRQPMELCDTAIPMPTPGQLLIRVSCCGVCRTDLHVVDGDLPKPSLPLVPGHQIVGRVMRSGNGPAGFAVNQRVGVPWLGGSCGECPYCRAGRENLCDDAVYTGYQLNGGFAEYAVADSEYCFALPDDYPDEQAARPAMEVRRIALPIGAEGRRAQHPGALAGRGT